MASVESEIDDKCATSFHESGHCVVAARFAEARVSSTSIRETPEGWEGNSDITVKYAVSLTAATIAVSGIVAEAQARSFKRHGADALLKLDSDTLLSISNYKRKPDHQLTEVEQKATPVYFYCPSNGQHVESAFSFDDRQRLPFQYAGINEVKYCIQGALQQLTDYWPAVIALSKALCDAPPETLIEWRQIEEIVNAGHR